jgi:hypothetical protein
MVVADFSESANNISFSTQLADVTVWDVADSIKLRLIDENGDLRDPTQAPPPMSVTRTDAGNRFFTYPNPFGRTAAGENDYSVAYFYFHLDEVSDVKVQVFTLLGELVWSDSREGLGTGVQARSIFWDGKNSNGQRVLNGGYIGAIEIRPVNGGKVQRYITKIAYIK